MCSARRCLECKSPLASSVKTCGCGLEWQKAAEEGHPHRCAYQLGDQRCPFFGVFSKARNTWYCRDHYHCLENNDRQGAEAVLVQAEEELATFLKKRCDWRDELVNAFLQKHMRTTVL